MTSSNLSLRCMLDYTYSPDKIIFTLDSPPSSLEQSPQSYQEADSQARVLSKTLNKTQLTTLTLCISLSVDIFIKSLNINYVPTVYQAPS